MKTMARFVVASVLVVVLGFTIVAKAQNGPGCSAGAALGKAHAELNTCVNGYRAGYEVSFATSPNQYGGYTVTVYAAPKCPQGQICPLYIFFLGSVDTDANCDVVALNSVCR